MSDKVSFPTKRQTLAGSYVAEVLDVYTGFNANYGGGRAGLYIKIRYENTGRVHDRFFPDPPAMKTDRLIQAVEDLGLDLDTIGWEGLIGYKFRWANENAQREVYIREKGAREMRTVQLEYPAEILEAPAAKTETAIEGDEPADYEAFKDEVLLLADGKEYKELRIEATRNATIRQAPQNFKDKLTSKEVLQDLMSDGRLEEVTDNGRSFYRAVLSDTGAVS